MSRDFSFQSKGVAGSKGRRQYFLLDGPQGVSPIVFILKKEAVLRLASSPRQWAWCAPVPGSHLPQLTSFLPLPFQTAPSAWSPQRTHFTAPYLRDDRLFFNDFIHFSLEKTSPGTAVMRSTSLVRAAASPSPPKYPSKCHHSRLARGSQGERLCLFTFKEIEGLFPCSVDRSKLSGVQLNALTNIP